MRREEKWNVKEGEEVEKTEYRKKNGRRCYIFNSTPTIIILPPVSL